MAITSILIQPDASSINSAYRPIILRVLASSNNIGVPNPPVVYCDIYINGTFYKTITRTQYAQLSLTDSQWEFDIQDAVQEQLSYYLAPNGGNTIINAIPVAVTIQCMFRCSGIDSDGFIYYDVPAPVQATGNTAAIAGSTANPSNIFTVVNATLQHEDVQDLAAHLNAYKNDIWAANAYPLTHRPNTYAIGLGHSDYFPVIAPVGSVIDSIRIFYLAEGASFYHQKAISRNVTTTGNVIYIPSGTKNLSNIFALDFTLINKYYVQITAAGEPLATTNVFNVSNAKDDIIHLHFLNYSGTIDAVSLILQSKVHEPKSDTWEKPLSYPLIKSQHNINRFNVSSNDTYTALTIDYTEDDQSWLDELKDSPLAWLEWDGGQGQAADYLPVILTDSKTEKINIDERFYNEMTVSFIMSNRKQILRN
jgi:hypothetical protein